MESLPKQHPSNNPVTGKPLDSSQVDLPLSHTSRGEIKTASAALDAAALIECTNAEFLAAVFPKVSEGAFAAVCTKAGDPTSGGWAATHADRSIAKIPASHNNYINCSSFYPGNDGSFTARKSQFSAYHFLMLDDIGTKVPLERLDKFSLSWLIETSPGNFQGGIILAEPITDGDVATRLLNAIIDAGLCDAGASGPLSRWARLPVAINGKPKYAGASGEPFKCRLVQWLPENRYTPEEIIAGLKLELAPAGRPKKDRVQTKHTAALYDDVYTPRAEHNPIVCALKERGLYKSPLGSGKHDITCPWVHEHTDQIDSGTAYFEPTDQYQVGGFCCQHSHRDTYKIRQLVDFLEMPLSAARNKPVIRVFEGELHSVVAAAEQVLGARGNYFAYGGLITSITTDAATGDPTIKPISVQALTKELSLAVTWEKFEKSSNEWIACDPPTRHLAILYDAQSYEHLPPLAGVVRQPYLRMGDGALIAESGYNTESRYFGVFDSRHFVFSEPTVDAAKAALALLEELIEEFSFVSTTDKAAALSAIFTAVTRSTLDYAPAFHVRAPVFGSGKTYLCELIGAFAGPGGNNKVSYPTTSEEATKVMLSLLLTSPAVIEFDDMDTDWIPHGTIKRMLTADKITDRILGYSKTATVSTRSLFLGSGNNVGPVRDLLRRVLTIHLDPRCATPATMSYKGNPIDEIRRNRGKYVVAVLTIIMAWRKAGCPRTAIDSIVTYGGAWTEYCRHPLIWLGHPDPATSLLNQVRHDPDGEPLAALMVAWRSAFGSAPTTVRKAVQHAHEHHSDSTDLLDALHEFPIIERGEINRSKLGWLLKKNANRIIDGHAFEQAQADGRIAWRVVAIGTPTSPPLPPSPTPTRGSSDGSDPDDTLAIF